MKRTIGNDAKYRQSLRNHGCCTLSAAEPHNSSGFLHAGFQL